MKNKLENKKLNWCLTGTNTYKRIRDEYIIKKCIRYNFSDKLKEHIGIDTNYVVDKFYEYYPDNIQLGVPLMILTSATQEEITKLSIEFSKDTPPQYICIIKNDEKYIPKEIQDLIEEAKLYYQNKHFDIYESIKQTINNQGYDFDITE